MRNKDDKLGQTIEGWRWSHSCDSDNFRHTMHLHKNMWVTQSIGPELHPLRAKCQQGLGNRERRPSRQVLDMLTDLKSSEKKSHIVVLVELSRINSKVIWTSGQGTNTWRCFRWKVGSPSHPHAHVVSASQICCKHSMAVLILMQINCHKKHFIEFTNKLTY